MPFQPLHESGRPLLICRGGRPPRARGRRAGLWGKPIFAKAGHDTTMVPSHFNATPVNTRTRAFRAVDAAHAPAAGPGSQLRRVPVRRSPEAVHGLNPLGRRPIGGLGSGPHRRCFAGGRGPPTRNYALGTPSPSQTRCTAFGVPFLRKESRFEASPSGFRLPPLVPGLFWFRARVILLADGPTRPTQRLPVRGKVPTFPHPEPPLLVVMVGVTPSPWESRTPKTSEQTWRTPCGVSE